MATKDWADALAGGAGAIAELNRQQRELDVGRGNQTSALLSSVQGERQLEASKKAQLRAEAFDEKKFEEAMRQSAEARSMSERQFQAERSDKMKELEERAMATAISITQKGPSDPRTIKEFNILAARFGLPQMARAVKEMDGGKDIIIEAGVAPIRSSLSGQGGFLPPMKISAPRKLLATEENRILKAAYESVRQDPSPSKMRDFEELLITADGKALTPTAQLLDPTELEGWFSTVNQMRQAQNRKPVSGGAIGKWLTGAKVMTKVGTYGAALLSGAGLLRGALGLAGRGVAAAGAPGIATVPNTLARGADAMARFGRGNVMTPFQRAAEMVARMRGGAPAAQGGVRALLNPGVPSPVEAAMARAAAARAGTAGTSVIPGAPVVPPALGGTAIPQLGAGIPAAASPIPLAGNAGTLVPGARAAADLAGEAASVARMSRVPYALAAGGGTAAALAAAPGQATAAEIAGGIQASIPGTGLSAIQPRRLQGPSSETPSALIVNGSRIPLPKIENPGSPAKAGIVLALNEIRLDPSAAKATQLMKHMSNAYEMKPLEWNPQEFNEIMRFLGRVKLERLFEAGAD